MRQFETKSGERNSLSLKLDSGERIGRKARNSVWSQTSSFLRRHWKTLLSLFATLFLSSLLPAFFLHGTVRWLFIGAIGATSFWLVVLGVTVWSGIAPLIMGIQGEANTADVLGEFKGKDWHLIHGMRFSDSGDIDHILVGPSGILVFETKWSRDRWPMKNERQTYITNQLNRAITQVKENREAIRTRLEGITDDVPIYAVCVLWSATDSSKDLPWFYRQSPDFVHIVRGPELKDWLLTLRKSSLNSDRINEIASEVKKVARDLDEQSPESYRRTLHRIVNDSIWLPAMGFLTPLLGIFAVSMLRNGYIVLVALVVLGALGLVVRHRSRLKAVTVCWFASLGLVVGFLLGHEILFLLR